MNIFKKVTLIILSLTIILGQSPVVLAIEAPTPPPAPSSEVTAPTPPPAPTAPPAPTPPPTPSELAASEPPAPTSTPTPSQTPRPSRTPRPTPGGSISPFATPIPSMGPAVALSTPTADTGNQTGGQNGDHQNSGAAVNTGDATNSVVTQALGNNNLAGSAGVTDGESGGSSVVNSDNGSDSDNDGSATVSSDNTTSQNNSAGVSNGISQNTDTGSNSASRNLGDSTINTGDANTTGTAITAVNTNVDGVAVAEFNIADDQRGDLVLDFARNCISGCSGGDLLAENADNGFGSTNDAELNNYNNSGTFQNNDAEVGNTLNLASNSGYNNASRNNQGDSIITTGNANVAANALTFTNNNLAGNVVYGVVNIFGDFVGDIIMPEDAMNFQNCGSCFTDLAAGNTGNGDGSINAAGINSTNNDILSQENVADIENNVNVDANSGGNTTSMNNGGGNSIETGNTSADVNVLNVANNNVSGGDMWLVIVNEAGNWIGRLMGAAVGQNFAGSEGTEFVVGANGEITTSNSGNAPDSTNNSTVTSENNNTTEQNNNAAVTNNLNLSANTGGNDASRNNGGDSKIITGDAKIVANIVNFVNNNITGGGKLYVVMVNVFGSWAGNFISPGYHKEETVQADNSHDSGQQSEQQPQGGTDNSQVDSSNTNTSNANTSTNTVVDSSNPEQGGNTVTVSNSDADTEGNLLLAGFQSGQNPLILGASKINAKNVLTLNLAWLLLLLPIIPLLVILKRLRMSRLPHNSL